MISHYITIHAPYGELILSGKKDIETRVRRIPEKFIGKRIGIYEPERGVLIGSVKVLGQKLYATAAEFRKDYRRHLVDAGSQYDIRPDATKIGIIVGSPIRDTSGRRPKKFAPSTIVKNNPYDYGAVVLHNPASSAKTSRPIIPAAAKVINWMPETTNFDMGGGKYENLTNFLKTKRVKNFVYDQFNRSDAHNAGVLRHGMTDTGSLFNVLNVIPDEGEMLEALRVLKQMVRGEVYISVYEGDGSGMGKTTRDGFQHNKKLDYYVPIVRRIFPDAKRMGIIIAANYTNQNPVPPAAVARTAKRGLAARKKYKRGGTAVGVARARDLSRRANVSQRTIDRMYSYFSRHRASRYENAKRISDPTSAARIADDLWGGSSGFRWAKKVRRR